jgi:hypothetical protein
VLLQHSLRASTVFFWSSLPSSRLVIRGARRTRGLLARTSYPARLLFQ